MKLAAFTLALSSVDLSVHWITEEGGYQDGGAEMTTVGIEAGEFHITTGGKAFSHESRCAFNGPVLHLPVFPKYPAGWSVWISYGRIYVSIWGVFLGIFLIRTVIDVRKKEGAGGGHPVHDG